MVKVGEGKVEIKVGRERREEEEAGGGAVVRGQ